MRRSWVRFSSWAPFEVRQCCITGVAGYVNIEHLPHTPLMKLTISEWDCEKVRLWVICKVASLLLWLFYAESFLLGWSTSLAQLRLPKLAALQIPGSSSTSLESSSIRLAQFWDWFGSSSGARATQRIFSRVHILHRNHQELQFPSSPLCFVTPYASRACCSPVRVARLEMNI